MQRTNRQPEFLLETGWDDKRLLDEMRKCWAKPMDNRQSLLEKTVADALHKATTVQTSTGLVNYDLQFPAKNVYPVTTLIRNMLPRVKGNGDVATRWKVVSAIIGSGYDAMGWVPEGGRSGVMTLNSSTMYVGYSTIGEEINLSFEAWSAAEGFEDEKSRNAIRNLQKMTLKEESALLGGNFSLALGAPTGMTNTSSNTGGSMIAGTYSAAVVALTYEGYRNWLQAPLIATGVPLTKTVTDPTGATYTLNGGSSDKSTTVVGTAITGSPGTGSAKLSCTPVVGAVAYAWYYGLAGAVKLQAVTTINSYAQLTPPLTTGQNITAITGDHSNNVGSGGVGGNPAAFDGLLYAAFSSSLLSAPGATYLPGAYVKSLGTGVAGTGTKLTASGKGTVNEIDDMLISMWNNYQVSPTVLWMNAQQIQDVTALCLSTSSAPLLRYDVDTSAGYPELMAGGNIRWYFNPFALNGGNKIRVEIHPYLPAGTILGWSENLPMQYQSNEVPNVAEVHYRRDYYQVDWPLRTRLYESGIYAEETLAVYAPFAMGVINNIAAGH